MRSVLGLGAFLILCLGTGYLGSVLTRESVRDWYPLLSKPAGTPPDGVFAPVWTTIFVLMAVSAWTVWRRTDFNRARTAWCLFGIQLGLNLVWSALFFGIRQPGIALVEITVLWSFISATLLHFKSHSRISALLLLPYWVWVSFAVYLNYGIWHLNP